MTRRDSGAGVVHGQADVDEDVVEDLGEVRRVAVERVVVQQHDRHAEGLGRAQERREVQRVAARAGRRHCRRTRRGAAAAARPRVAVQTPSALRTVRSVMRQDPPSRALLVQRRATSGRAGARRARSRPTAVRGDALAPTASDSAAGARPRTRSPGGSGPPPAGPRRWSRAGGSRARAWCRRRGRPPRPASRSSSGGSRCRRGTSPMSAAPSIRRATSWWPESPGGAPR